jgi:colanic acid biosynthesis glycosyl transferase WcaI
VIDGIPCSTAFTAEKPDPAPVTPVPRVVFVNRFFYPDISATSQMLTDLATRLAGSGIDVHVICSRRRYLASTEQPLPSREKTIGGEVHRIWSTDFGRHGLLGRTLDYLTFYWSAFWAMLTVIRSGDVLVVKTDPPLLSVCGAVAARLRGATLVNWLQDIFPEIATCLWSSPMPRWLDDRVRQLRDWSLRAAALNVVLGERMAAYLQQRGLPEARVRIIENWADDELIVPMSPCASLLREQLDLQDRFVVSYSGNLGRAHEHRTILEAAAQLAADPDIVFLMVGGGAKMTRLREEVASRRLRNFIFLPYRTREALSDSLGAADVHLVCLMPGLEEFVVPSKFYGVLAAARPVIYVGHPDGDLPRLIRETGCGSVAGDALTLAGELQSLKADPERRSSGAARAREILLERFAANGQARSWRATLRELCPGLPESREAQELRRSA